MNKEVYLGDGLYASFDGYMIVLRAPRSAGDHWVGLEPEILRAFQLFCEQFTVRPIKDDAMARSIREQIEAGGGPDWEHK
jgi:hypothetical protein